MPMGPTAWLVNRLLLQCLASPIAVLVELHLISQVGPIHEQIWAFFLFKKKPKERKRKSSASGSKRGQEENVKTLGSERFHNIQGLQRPCLSTDLWTPHLQSTDRENPANKKPPCVKIRFFFKISILTSLYFPPHLWTPLNCFRISCTLFHETHRE